MFLNNSDFLKLKGTINYTNSYSNNNIKIQEQNANNVWKIKCQLIITIAALDKIVIVVQKIGYATKNRAYKGNES
jgi:hypothetical protein